MEMINAKNIREIVLGVMLGVSGYFGAYPQIEREYTADQMNVETHQVDQAIKQRAIAVNNPDCVGNPQKMVDIERGIVYQLVCPSGDVMLTIENRTTGRTHIHWVSIANLFVTGKFNFSIFTEVYAETRSELHIQKSYPTKICAIRHDLDKTIHTIEIDKKCYDVTYNLSGKEISRTQGDCKPCFQR